MAAAGAGFRFDDDNSDDDFGGDRMGSPGAAAKAEDGMHVDGMRVDLGRGLLHEDWGECRSATAESDVPPRSLMT